jgi:paraquat-inducible protein B
MSRRANPTVIGAFVVGAVIIAVVAVMVLTSGQLFQKNLNFVIYFDGSVKGLNVGAPVTYRGVQVGTVKNIEIVLTHEADATIPVTVEIRPSAFTLVGYERKMTLEEFQQGIDESSRNEGLRAQLQMQSMLTGQLFIQLDYFPGTPVRFLAKDGVPEIPSVPTTLQEISKILEDFPIKTVLANLSAAVEGLKNLTSDLQLEPAIELANQAFNDFSKLVNNLDERTEPLEPALVESRQALVQAKQALAQATATLSAAETTFVKGTQTLGSMKQLVADDSEILESLDEALRAISGAAESLSTLAETLERQPEAIIRGKGVFGGD